MAEEIPKFDAVISIDNLGEEAKAFITSYIRQQWKLPSVNTEVFTAGSTNVLIGCYMGDSILSAEEVILIKVYGEGSEIYIDRDTEIRNMHFLWKHECGPPVFARFLNGLCYGFVPGTMCEEAMLYKSPYSGLIAKEMARLHCLPIDKDIQFHGGVFDTIERYLRLLPENFDDPKIQDQFQKHFPGKDRMTKDFADLKSRLNTRNLSIFYCHNDLIYKNIIINSDETRAFFIDHEFGELNYEGFDIGNYFNEFAGNENVDYSKYPSDEFQKNWIRIYLTHCAAIRGEGRDVTDEKVNHLFVLASYFSLVAHVWWATWGLIQVVHSKLDFDFIGFSIARYNEYRKRRDQRLGLLHRVFGDN